MVSAPRPLNGPHFEAWRWPSYPGHSSIAGASESADADNDGIFDSVDNCQQESNPSQLDTDGDGFGNRCDPDFNNDLVVNFIDLGIVRSRFFTNDADSDLNEDGAVNFVDLGILRSFFFMSPGPSAFAN